MKYRIVTDSYNGFEVQSWRWWWPIWTQVGVNSSVSVRQAKEWLDKYLIRRKLHETFKSCVIEEWEAP